MHRRHFLQTAFAAAASAPLSGARTLRANDVVQLGPDKIRLTRLAIGTGTTNGVSGTGPTGVLGTGIFAGMADVVLVQRGDAVEVCDASGDLGLDVATGVASR